MEFRVRTKSEERIVNIIEEIKKRMKLPDFSKHVGLNQLRQQMGAGLISWRSGGDWKPIDIDELLVEDGIDILPDEIEYAPDGTLEYEGRKVIVYIRDQSNSDQYVLDSYGLIDPEQPM